jgi:chaperonin GroES
MKTNRPSTKQGKESDSMAVKIKPLGDRVLVEPVEDKETSKGGIIIPDSAKEKPQEAKVIALGTGKRDDDGKIIPFEVKVGDIVLTSKYGGTEVKLDDKTYKILSVSDILGIVG